MFKYLDSCDLGIYGEDYLVDESGEFMAIRYISYNHLTVVI